MGDRIMYNEIRVLEVGSWRILCPNAYGKKYRNTENPLLIHKCPKEFSRLNLNRMDIGDEELEFYSQPDRSDGNPKCKLCKDPIPDEIQGLLAMFYMDKE